MIVKYTALDPLLQKKTHSLYVLIGNEPYLLNDAALKIKQAFQKKADCSPTILDVNTPADWAIVINEANSYSLFSDQVLLDVRLDKKSIDASGKELLLNYLEAVNSSCLILLRAPLIPIKSLQWLVDNPEVAIVQALPFTDQALKTWIAAQFVTKKLQVEPTVPHQVYEYTQGNMLAAAQFIDKLSIVCSPNEVITPQLVNDHLSDQSHFELFELAKSCLEANAHKTLRLLHQSRCERTEPTLLLWILSQEIRLLIQLHYLIKQSVLIENACSQLKIWSSRTFLYTKAIKRLPLDSLYPLLYECKQIDEMIKTSQSTQIWNKFEFIALALCGVTH